MFLICFARVYYRTVDYIKETREKEKKKINLDRN